MGGIAKGVKDTEQVHRDAGVGMPDIGHRDAQVFGKSAWPVYANPAGIFAEVPPPGQTVAAATADNMTLARNGIAD